MSNSLKFDAMTESQRASWLRWANSHDWGAGEARFTHNLENCELQMHVECAACDADGEVFIETALVATPRELRNWAGY